MEPEEKTFDQKLQERFAQLPKVVQDAITSTDVEKRLRTLSDTNKLHIDQWETLENEVMLTLLGFSPVEELTENIKTEVGVPESTAQELAKNISTIVFEPIREELERELDHPAAKDEEVSDIDATREHILSKEHSASSPVPVTPATPPVSPPEKKAGRAPSHTSGPASGAYKPGETSTERKIVADDPYRESPA